MPFGPTSVRGPPFRAARGPLLGAPDFSKVMLVRKHERAGAAGPTRMVPVWAVVAKCMSWIYLLSELFAKSRKVANSRKVESARKDNDDKKSHPPKGRGACRVLLAGVSFLKAFLLEADSL